MCIEVTVTTETIASVMAQFKGEVYLRNKTSVSVFYRGNKLWVLVKSYATILIPTMLDVISPMCCTSFFGKCMLTEC